MDRISESHNFLLKPLTTSERVSLKIIQHRSVPNPSFYSRPLTGFHQLYGSGKTLCLFDRGLAYGLVSVCFYMAFPLQSGQEYVEHLIRKPFISSSFDFPAYLVLFEKTVMSFHNGYLQHQQAPHPA